MIIKTHSYGTELNETKRKMKALVLKQHGSLEDVGLVDVKVPVIGPDEVLVEIRAAALNRLDLWVLEGWRGLNLTFPHILGCDGSGIVVDVGEEVTNFTLGDRVAINPTRSCGRCDYCRAGKDHMCDRFAIFGEHIPGFYSQYQAVPARNLIILPNGFSYDEAAAASLVYVTAWHSLIETGKLRAGEDVLIIGAGGGVNLASVDIARFAGAKTIYVVGSNDRKLALAQKQGAHVIINRHKEHWPTAIFQATDQLGVDLVVDNVGAETFHQSLRSLKKGGRLLTVGNTTGPLFELDNRYVFGKHISILGSTMGPQQTYRHVMDLIFQGKLKPIIDKVFPLSDGLAAFKQMKRGEVAGKLILHPYSHVKAKFRRK